MSLITVHCRHCGGEHTARFLCDPAKAVLDALAAKAAERDMPTLEFLDEPIDANALGYGLDPGDRMMRQLVVQAAAVAVGGTDIVQPALIFTGADHTGNPLPRWMYAGTPSDMDRAAKLVTDMCALAVRGARQKRPR